ncbi:MAG TPA: ABC transporter transmembrane domain-containing protein [Acidimicrobiia bacterium]|nr:ABC transporter transmembrane domain-containing protein [Acidimicrobiia bacterium]
MSGGYRIEIREPGRAPRQQIVDDTLELGRECDGVVLDDPKVSRRHVQLRATDAGLVVSDLGSSNGTFVDGARIANATAAGAGATIRVGATEIVVVGPVTPEAPVAPVAPVAPERTLAPAVRPALDELVASDVGVAILRYRARTSGEAAAGAVAASARRARKRLAGFGSEPWGVKPQICLVDPFPDPDRPGEVMTSGTIVDTERGEIWMVVTPEAPPEPTERALAIFFGAALPAAADLGVLLEGYGLFVAGTPDPDRQLRELTLPPLGSADADADGEVASAMALSFVRYLVERGGIDGFQRLLAESAPHRVDTTAQDLYGEAMASLEESWRQKLRAGPADVEIGQFIRLNLRYLRPHIRREAEMFVYMLFGLAFTMVFPFAVRRLFDHAIPSGKFSNVLTILIVLGVAFVVSLLADLRRAYLAAYVSGSVVRQLRTEMFDRLQELHAGWFNERQEGDIMSRLFSDVYLLEQGLSQTMREGFFQILSLVVASVVLLTLNPLLGLVVLAGAPVIAMVYRAMAKGAQKRSIAVQEQTGSLYNVASENYGAQSVVRAFALEAREKARFGRASQRLFDAERRMQLFGGLFGLSVNMVVTLLRLIVLGLGSWLILHGHLTLGGLVAFMGLMGEVLSPVTSLTSLGQQIQSATGALVRINEVLNAEPEIADGPDATIAPALQHEIRLDHVGFAYTPERPTLDDVSAVVAAGSRVAFVGPTGAGKSSVLQLLMRTYDPAAGAITFDGIDLRSVTVASWRGQLGVVFQDTFLFDTTIRENIEMARPGATAAEVEAAARAAELHEFITELPRGYDTLVGERGGRLSGGQRQRLAIARALLRDPLILLLDEATSALDPRTERLIANTLDRVGAGRTTIAVTHRLTSITDYDRIFVVVAGQLVEQGTHEELVRAGGTYSQLWSEQVGGHAATEAPFDAPAALARLPIFAGLDPAGLEAVAGRLRADEIAAGARVAESSGRLLVLRRGRARLLVPGLDGQLAPAAELGPGDAFGLSALLGRQSGAFLEAIETVSALVLDDEAIAGIAATHPTVGAALDGSRVPSVAPAGGRRLSRMTIAPRARPSLGAAAPSGAIPTAEAVRRASGSYGAIQP